LLATAVDKSPLNNPFSIELKTQFKTIEQFRFPVLLLLLLFILQCSCDSGRKNPVDGKMARDDSRENNKLRLTPTSLRRVQSQRDVALQNVKELTSRVAELEAALQEHNECEAKIEGLKCELNALRESSSKAMQDKEARDAAFAKQALALSVSEHQKKSLQMDVEKLNEAMETSSKILERQKGAMKRVEELEKEIERERERNCTAATEPPSGNSGVTMEQVIELLEACKVENLLTLVSERVYIHVVAPKTVLKIGEEVEQTYLPPAPSEAVVQKFIADEILPQFEPVFRSLNDVRYSVNGNEKMAAPASRLAPDGGTVHDYAQKFSSVLASFIQKCVLEAQSALH
jgi:hypothetical protein